MLKCEECNREFQDYTSLGSHIGQSHRDIGIKNYYDKYLKKDPNEGICKNSNCKNETKFIGLTLGYSIYCSYTCSSKSKDYQEIKLKHRNEQICELCGRKFISKTALSAHINHPNSIHKEEIKKIKELENKKRNIKCELCGRNFKSFRTLGIHLNQKHGNYKREFVKNYYDKYLRKDPSEGICICGNKTEFILLSKGYNKYCKQKCYMNNGGASHANFFITNPSKPQVELYNRVKELYSTAILNYPCNQLNYSLDIAIPELMICFESDGSFWHQDNDKDLERQKQIEDLGWKFIRYLSDSIKDVPSKEQILNDINGIIQQ